MTQMSDPSRLAATRRGARLLPIALLLAFGCSAPAPTTQPDSITGRQDKALKDPMGYKVPDTPDASTGDNHSLKRDLNDVINP
jgi:hypothetical protein